MPQPDDLVLHAFRAPTNAGAPEAMGYAWDHGWRIGDVVYSQAAVYASWSAKVREKLAVPGMRVARPVLATNGRHVVGGWKATQFIPGDLTKRVDEAAQVALRIEDALEAAAVPAPQNRDDIFARAEAAAWAETGDVYPALEPHTTFVTGHADVLGTVLFSGVLPPVLVDAVPTAAPRARGFSAALAIVDGLIAEAVDTGICDRFAYLPNMDLLLLRAVAYRRHVNNLHPAATTTARSRIHEVEEFLVSRVSETLSS